MTAASASTRSKSSRSKKSASAMRPVQMGTSDDFMMRDRAVRDIVYRSCLTLDRMDFEGFLRLCAPKFQYVISTFSPELRKDIVWLDRDMTGMKTLVDVLPLHVSDHMIRLNLSRHATVYTVNFSADLKQADAVSGLQVYTTARNGGATNLFAVAKYYDTVKLSRGAAKLLRREVRLDTRMLGETGTLIPL